MKFKINKKILSETTKKFYFKPTQKVLKELEKDFIKIQNDLLKLQKINTKGIKPMYQIDNTPIKLSNLRSDTTKIGFSKQQVLKNAPLSNRNFIVVKKVFK